MEQIAVMSDGPYLEFSLPLGVSYISDRPSSILRIGEFYGPSKCTLLINDEGQVDVLINRLLEIKKLFTDSKG